MGLLSVAFGVCWLLETHRWLVKRPLLWQGSRVQLGRVCGFCLNPRTRMPLRRWDLGMGYGGELSVYCPEAPLSQFLAERTCVHTLMCFLYILQFRLRVARILECFGL